MILSEGGDKGSWVGVKGWGNVEAGKGGVVEQHLPALGGLDSFISGFFLV